MRPLLVLIALCFALPAHAVVEIDWVEVGDPGNACDVQSQGCFGSVAYTYWISKYEVTNAQYAEFLNAVATSDPNGLYNTFMDPANSTPSNPFGGISRSGAPGSFTYTAVAGREDGPVAYVSFFDAQRFANWLHNGQPVSAQGAGTTEDGAYTFAGADPDLGPDRNLGALFVVPSEDEWYKAAYYDTISMTYKPYPFADGFDGAVCEPPPGATSHSANCSGSGVNDHTDVGSYINSPSANGTFDQGGNVYEWNEAINVEDRGVRGGQWSALWSWLAASSRTSTSAYYEDEDMGFRVAMIPGPTATPSPSVLPTPTGGPTPTWMPTATPTLMPTSTATPTPTAAPTPTWVPTATPQPTATPTPQPSAPLDKDQQACVNEMNKNGAKVNKAQFKENETCLKDHQKGKLTTTFEVCTTDDRKNKMQKADDKLVQGEAKKCDQLPVAPPFAFTGSTTVFQAGVDGAMALTYAIFGGPPVLDADLATKVGDKDKAKCQLGVLKQASKLENTVLKQINKAKKEAIKKEWVGSSSLLETALTDVFIANDKIASAEQKFANGVEKKCASLQDPAGTFPGACANPDLGMVEKCVIAAARCQACLKINAFDDLKLDCDDLDDGVANTSCR